jgi:gamma-glutamyltranspeptidase/glutathione hydrolase/leukotriene-C4 hydrolase
MVVTISSTVNFIFGSRVMDPVTGILFNDEVCDIVFMTLEGSLE